MIQGRYSAPAPSLLRSEGEIRFPLALFVQREGVGGEFFRQPE